MHLRKKPFIIIVVATVVRLILAASVPLFPDETYYWEWSRHLAAGYFDHPPAIALLIRAGTVLFGDTRLGVRIGAVLAGTIVSWALLILARRLDDRQSDDDRSAIMVTWLSLCIPLALVGFVLATPDAPLLAATAVMLVALDRAFAAPYRSSEALRWWCATGVMFGVGLCAKYTAVLVPFGVFCAMAIHPSLRIRFRELGPYVATLLAIVIFAPVIVWNANHRWISFVFQVNHGLGHHRGSMLLQEGRFIGGQLGLISPIVAVMAGIAVVRTLRDATNSRRFATATIAAVIALFFVVSALRKSVEANWPAPALIATIPLLATWEMRGTARRWFRWGLGLATVCTLVICTHALFGILPLAPRRDPIAKAYGWERVALQVERVRDTVVSQRCTHAWIAADRYQDASELAFHMTGHPQVFALNLGGRANQYNLWPTLGATVRQDDCIVLVVDDDPNGAAIVRRVAFDRGRPEDAGSTLLLYDGRPIGSRHIWVVRRGT